MLLKRWLIVLLSVLFVLWLHSPVNAAEVALQEIYRVPAETTIDDDLYVNASEVYIDGVVTGDVLALAGYVEINGRVEGDLMAVAGGVGINGEVGDDVRLLTGGLQLTNSIGGDLVLLAGGNGGFSIPQSTSSGATIQQGVIVDENSVIGGDMLVSAGWVDFNGRIEGDLNASLLGAQSNIVFNGVVTGDAKLDVLTLDVSDNGRVEGTFTYSAPERLELPGQLAEDVVYTPLVSDDDIGDLLVQQLIRMVSAITGFALMGWIMLRYFPRTIMLPVAVIQAHSTGSAWTGVISILLIPFVTFLVALLISVFWGLFPAMLVIGLVLGCLFLLALFSPLVTGLWLGLRFNAQPLTALIIGVVILVPLMQAPFFGGFISTASFLLVLGSIILPRLGRQKA